MRTRGTNGCHHACILGMPYCKLLPPTTHACVFDQKLITDHVCTAVQHHGLSGIPAGLSLIEYSRGMIAYSEEVCEQALKKRARDESAVGEESGMGAAKRPSGSAWFLGAVQGLSADRARLEAQVRRFPPSSLQRQMSRNALFTTHSNLNPKIQRADCLLQVQNMRGQSYMEMCRKTILELHGPSRELEGESDGGAFLILPGVA